MNMMARFNHEPREIPSYILADFRRLFIQDSAERYGVRFDVGNFIGYVKTHTYHGEDYGAYLRGFVGKKVAEEHCAYQEKKRLEAEEHSRKIGEENEVIRAKAAAEAEAKSKERARRAYPFSDEAFEADWPRIRAELALKEVAERRKLVASPRDYARGVPGGFTTPLGPTEPR